MEATVTGLDIAAAAAAAVAGAGATIGIHGSTTARSCLWGRVTWRGPVDSRQVALTFDDGPTAGATEPILDLLKSLAVPAAFFVIGRNVDVSPGIVRRAFDDGHLIGNHSYDHSHSGFLHGTRYWDEQLKRTTAAVAGVTGNRPRFFRPPIGVRTWRTMRAVSRGKYILVNWSKRGYDGLAAATADSIQSRLLGRLEGGDIVLLHDGVEPGGRRNPAATVAALPGIVASARDRGLEWVRLDRLLGVDGYTL
jgi:peptidoglycan/xylan/chitin deacetylase (PgdA/CDA1 family)